MKMKTVHILVFLFLLPAFLCAQQPARSDTIVPGKGAPKKQLSEIKQEKVKQLSDTTSNEPKKSNLVDTTIQNKYGDLLNDDTAYNRKYPLWIPLLETAGANAFV